MDNKEYNRRANQKLRSIRIMAEDWEVLRDLSAESLVSMTKMLHKIMPLVEREFRNYGKKDRD